MIQKPISLELAATLCGVSSERARKWIDKHGLKAGLDSSGETVINPVDLIDFLVRYNMSIPEAIVPQNTRKILIVYPADAEDKKFLRYIIGFIRRLRKGKNSFIADQVQYGPEVVMKIMVFRPDIILFDAVDNLESVIAVSRQVSSSREFGTIRIIAYVNADYGRENIDRLIDAGVDEFASDTDLTPLKGVARQLQGGRVGK